MILWQHNYMYYYMIRRKAKGWLENLVVDGRIEILMDDDVKDEIRNGDMVVQS